MQANRRRFLKQTAAAGSLLTVPYIWTSRTARAQDENSKPTVAAIGVGGSRGAYNQGGAIARRAANFGRLVAVCDVDDRHTAEFNKDFDGRLAMYRDYRELLEKENPEIVTIGTPDHWHVPISIAAMRAGCDVYCEKPLTLTIDEGKQIREVVKETGRVFQVGTQQRSQDELRFLKAIAIVQSGRLGERVNAHVAIGGAPSGGPFEGGPAPDDLDWNMWLGPAPEADYSEQRRKEFRWFFEYSGGKMTDWGAHHIDIAQWALGFNHSGPVRINGDGKFPPIIPEDFNWNAFLDGNASLPSAFNTATKFHIDLEFESGAQLGVHDRYRREGDNVDFGNGILFEGEKGRIFVNRGKLEGRPVDELSEADEAEIAERITELYKGKQPGDHMRNFFECLEDRSEPISDVATHHRTMTSCHLCNISLMLGRELRWDPQAEKFIGDDQADALLSRESRSEFVVEA